MDPQFELAERVAEIARSLEIEVVLIGATALAAYGYVRATSDIDFASVADPFADLPRLEKALQQAGLRTKLYLPDDIDALGGVLRAWEKQDEEGDPIDPIDIVNFYNPHHPVRLPIRDFIRDAIELDGKPGLRYVQFHHLILMKMYSGGPRDAADVVTLLEKNPGADLEQVRSLCATYDLGGIDELITKSKQGSSIPR